MASRVFLHAGLPKTGTTYLQGIVWGNREALAEQGLLVPGGRHDHFRSALDVRGVAKGPSHPRRDVSVIRGTWEHVRAEVEAWDGSALLSHELFAGMTVRQIRAFVESLDPSEVHVVVTARDLARAIPAAWQQSVKTGRRLTFGEYTRSVVDETDATRWFRRAQFPEAVLARWRQVLPPEWLHLVTVPHHGTDFEVLWDRFVDVLGVEIEVDPATRSKPNLSLGAAEAELLRRVNVVVRPRLKDREIARWIKDELGRNVLGKRPPGARIGLDPEAHAWAVRRAERTVEALREGGYAVHGDLDDLLPAAAPDGGHDPDTVDAEELLAVGIDTIAEQVVRIRDRSWQFRRVRRQIRAQRRQLRELRGEVRRLRRAQRRRANGPHARAVSATAGPPAASRPAASRPAASGAARPRRRAAGVLRRLVRAVRRRVRRLL